MTWVHACATLQGTFRQLMSSPTSPAFDDTGKPSPLPLCYPVVGGPADEAAPRPGMVTAGWFRPPPPRLSPANPQSGYAAGGSSTTPLLPRHCWWAGRRGRAMLEAGSAGEVSPPPPHAGPPPHPSDPIWRSTVAHLLQMLRFLCLSDAAARPYP